jgi:hypothetical protein
MGEIKSNEELMSFVRAIAVNVYENINFEGQRHHIPPSPLMDTVSVQILKGNYDGDPVVSGIVRGLSVMVASSHEPTKIMITECSKVKEAPYVVERIARARDDERKPQHAGPQLHKLDDETAVLSFGSVEELFEFLAKGSL